MRILFLGGLFPESQYPEIVRNSSGPVQNAANNLQWSILKGLIHYTDSIDVITIPFLGSYPFEYKKPFYRGIGFKLMNKINGISAGFLTLPFINLLSRYHSTRKELRKWIRHTDEEVCILIYSVHTPFLKSAIKIKKNNKNVKLCLFVPDLPEYMSENKHIIYLFFKKIDVWIINRAIKKVDYFVVLTDTMLNKLNISNKPFVRIEGIYNFDEALPLPEKEKKKTILYTGNIDKRYGILNLVKAFKMINSENFQLWIRGEGNTKSVIIEEAKKDHRIKYLEKMSRSELLKLQRNATVLVNPALPIEEYTTYSFPSKIMEYIASGTPCILFRLKGIPDEYFDYCFVPLKEDIESLSEIIVNVCNKGNDELEEFGKKASEFILKHKNPVIQAEKIYKMLIE